VTGTGVLDDVEGTVHLELALPDGVLRYDDDGSTVTVEGTYGGQPVQTVE
jgi:hypothetical protein